ncbi:hypothetical protein [Streptomyces sp. CRN 30]|uniref:hypothetical protein n=1 Tax=Streptomyces sp. CRN 30 TaxID=3075613 RepID=UPI002A8111E1|nr:hypothetical protein [Streptomyces sp. CRN 30]
MNHGPDEQGPDVQGPDGPETDAGAESRTTEAGAGSGADSGSEAGGAADSGLAPDELALRDLLQQAVREVEPRDGALDHLRRAVPARRARKRQAAVGMAAAALFVGTAVPALVHVSNSTGPGANPSVAGNASQAQGGAGQGKDPAGGQSATVGSSDKGEDKDEPGREEKDEEKEAATGSGGSATGADPTTPSGTGTAECTAAQLGGAVGSSAAPDSTGVVYGSFRVSNVSSAGCTVGGPGSVTVTAQGAADPARIGTARHVAGDPASGLPDPSLEAGQVLLKPGASYEVRFAWVPSDTCPTTGGSTGGTGDPSPDPTPTETSTGSTDTATSAGATTQLGTQLVSDVPADGSVAVTYTADTGSGAATAVVPNACAGTVYWTGVMAG